MLFDIKAGWQIAAILKDVGSYWVVPALSAPSEGGMSVEVS